MLACYCRTFWAGYIWDDDFYVWNNPTLKSLGGILDIWFHPLSIPQYYPLVHTSYWLEYRLWGDHPAGYHAVNVLLHAASSILLWRVLRRLDMPAAWLGGLLFAVHPVCVESVAWVTERKNTLSMCLALASLLAWLEFRTLDQPDESTTSSRWRWYGISLALFAASLLAKTVTVSLVGVLLVVTWWKTGRLTLRDLRLALPYVAVGLPLALATVWLEKHHVGAADVDWGLSPLDRIVLAGRVICFYAGKLLWPHPLAFFYDRWQIDAREAWQWRYPAAVLAAIAAAWIAIPKVGRGPLAAILIFSGCLFPALGFFDVYPFKFSFVADHFAYHAVPVFLASVSAAAAVILRRSLQESWPIAPIPICMLFALLTFVRTAVYADLEALCTDTLARNPAAWAARNILGSHYSDLGRFAEADRIYAAGKESAEVPPWPHDLAMFNNNHALAVAGLGRAADAEALYREAIRLDPAYDKPRSNLAKLLADHGHLARATAEYRGLLTLPLGSVAQAKAHFNLGTVYADEQAWPDAEHEFRAALKITPDAPECLEWLGIVVLRQGRIEEAIRAFQGAIASAADEAAVERIRRNLNTALLLSRDRRDGP